MSSILRGGSVAAGNFFFKYRNAIFPVVFAAFLIVMRPRMMFGDPVIDRALVICGFAVALAGELVRLSTIGFEYIERGGKQGKVYASFLVRKGVYGISRNPMYVGNMLIGIGIVMASGAPAAYVTVIPFFAFVYHAITSAEEEFLHKKFGAAYEEYCAHVPRFLPALSGFREAFSGIRFDARRPFKQDLSTITWIAMVLTALPFWRAYFLHGWDFARRPAVQTAVAELAIVALSGMLAFLKKRKSPLFYPREERDREKQTVSGSV